MYEVSRYKWQIRRFLFSMLQSCWLLYALGGIVLLSVSRSWLQAIFVTLSVSITGLLCTSWMDSLSHAQDPTWRLSTPENPNPLNVTGWKIILDRFWPYFPPYAHSPIHFPGNEAEIWRRRWAAVFLISDCLLASVVGSVTLIFFTKNDLVLAIPPVLLIVARLIVNFLFHGEKSDNRGGEKQEQAARL